MIDINDYDILKSNISTLKDASKDNHDGADSYMTESIISVVNFDKVKDAYISNIKVPEAPKSVDALFLDASEGQSTFIEFKNGNVNRKKEFNVRLKAFDSLLILLDIIGKTVNYSRAHMQFILVYNENRNLTAINEKDDVQPSASRTEIARTLLEKKAKRKFIRFNLERFEKLYFKEVYTYTEQEFEVNFIAKHSFT